MNNHQQIKKDNSLIRRLIWNHARMQGKNLRIVCLSLLDSQFAGDILKLGKSIK